MSLKRSLDGSKRIARSMCSVRKTQRPNGIERIDKVNAQDGHIAGENLDVRDGRSFKQAGLRINETYDAKLRLR